MSDLERVELAIRRLVATLKARKNEYLSNPELLEMLADELTKLRVHPQ